MEFGLFQGHHGECKRWGRKALALQFLVALLFADFCGVIFSSTLGEDVLAMAGNGTAGCVGQQKQNEMFR